MESSIIKQDAKVLKIKEQILYNDASGLTIDFVVVPNDKDCPYRLRIYGEALPFGNRQFEINSEGVITGAGTATQNCPFPFDQD